MIAATNTAANTQTNTHTAVLCFTSVHTSTGYRLDIGAARAVFRRHISFGPDAAEPPSTRRQCPLAGQLRP